MTPFLFSKRFAFSWDKGYEMQISGNTLFRQNVEGGAWRGNQNASPCNVSCISGFEIKISQYDSSWGKGKMEKGVKNEYRA